MHVSALTSPYLHLHPTCNSSLCANVALHNNRIAWNSPEIVIVCAHVYRIIIHSQHISFGRSISPLINSINTTETEKCESVTIL